MNELIRGGIYEIRSRNLIVAIYDGDGGFTGIREKLGNRYLFTEYLREGGRFGALGTVRPGRQLATLLPALMRENFTELVTTCQQCGMRAWWTGPPGPAPWQCEGRCEKTQPLGHLVNPWLFELLDSIAPWLELGE